MRTKTKVRCPECGKLCKNGTGLAAHRRHIHNDKVSDPEPAAGDVPCTMNGHVAVEINPIREILDCLGHAQTIVTTLGRERAIQLIEALES